MPLTTTARTEAAQSAEERWLRYYQGLMAALRSEDMQGAQQQAELAAVEVGAYLRSAGSAEERARRAEQLLFELGAARRSAIATKEFLRQQVLTVKPTAAYSAQTQGEYGSWSTSL